MSRIRVVIAEDEAPARSKVRRLLREHAAFELAGEAASGAEALDLIREIRPDLVLLDVQMPPPNGLEIAEELHATGDTMPHVIFVTAYDAYAVKAFDVHALDYLLKPFDAARFARALQRAEAAIRSGRDDAVDRLEQMLSSLRRPEPYLERVLARRGEKAVLLRTADIDWIEAAQNYVMLHIGSESYIIRGTLRELESRLDPRTFSRIHRSRIVNLDRVRELHPWSHGDVQVVLTDGTRLMMSRRYRDRLPMGS